MSDTLSLLPPPLLLPPSLLLTPSLFLSPRSRARSLSSSRSRSRSRIPLLALSLVPLPARPKRFSLGSAPSQVPPHRRQRRQRGRGPRRRLAGGGLHRRGRPPPRVGGGRRPPRLRRGRQLRRRRACRPGPGAGRRSWGSAPSWGWVTAGTLRPGAEGRSWAHRTSKKTIKCFICQIVSSIVDHALGPSQAPPARLALFLQMVCAGGMICAGVRARVGCAAHLPCMPATSAAASPGCWSLRPAAEGWGGGANGEQRGKSKRARAREGGWEGRSGWTQARATESCLLTGTEPLESSRQGSTRSLPERRGKGCCLGFSLLRWSICQSRISPCREFSVPRSLVMTTLFLVNFRLMDLD